MWPPSGRRDAIAVYGTSSAPMVLPRHWTRTTTSHPLTQRHPLTRPALGVSSSSSRLGAAPSRAHHSPYFATVNTFRLWYCPRRAHHTTTAYRMSLHKSLSSGKDDNRCQWLALLRVGLSVRFAMPLSNVESSQNRKLIYKFTIINKL